MLRKRRELVVWRGYFLGYHRAPALPVEERGEAGGAAVSALH